MKFIIALLGVLPVFLVHAAPAPLCIDPEKFVKELYSVINKDLGSKFTQDFNAAFKNTYAITQLDDLDCLDMENVKFLCSTLVTVYHKRVPGSSGVVKKDCQSVITKLFTK